MGEIEGSFVEGSSGKGRGQDTRAQRRTRALILAKYNIYNIVLLIRCSVVLIRFDSNLPSRRAFRVFSFSLALKAVARGSGSFLILISDSDLLAFGFVVGCWMIG